MADPTELPPACRRLARLAERDPRRAVALARRALEHAADTPLRPWAAYALGYALLCWERPAEARDHLLAAEPTLAALSTLAGLRCRHALLLTDVWLTDRTDLAESFAELAAALDAAGAPAEAARARLDQARQLLVRGRTREAERVLEDIAEAPGAPAIDRARWLRASAVAALQRDDYARADELLAAAERGSAGHLPDLARCALDRGWLERRRERLDLAVASYERAERAYDRLDLPIRRAFCAMNQGGALSMRGEYDAALAACHRAMASFTALGRMGEVGFCLTLIGNVHYYTRRWAAARACYARAEGLCRERGFLSEAITARRNQAMVAQAAGEAALAEQLVADVVAAAGAAGLPSEVAEATAIRASLRADAGDTAGAAAAYGEARERFRALGNVGAAAECELELAWLALRQGDPGAAEGRARAAAEVLGGHPHHAWRAAHALGRCAEARGDGRQALAHYAAAMRTVARLRRRLASEEVSARLAAEAAELAGDALRLAHERRDAETLLGIAEAQRALVLQRLLQTPARGGDGLRAEREQLQAQIAGALALRDDAALDAALQDYADLLIRSRSSLPPPHATDLLDLPLDLAALRAQLGDRFGDGWTAVSYARSGDDLLAVTLTPHAASLHTVHLDRRLARALVRATDARYLAYTYGAPGMRDDGAEPWADLRALADRLLPAEARARLHPAHRLLIVAAGPLHALPWGALRLAEGWLAERAIVQVMPSLAVARTLLGRRAPGGRPALLVGASSFGGRAPDLPGTAAELDAVAARWAGPSARWAEGAASRAALREASARGDLAGYGVLHLTTHARLLPRRGLAAHLVLSDGELLLPEVAELRLDGALVVLSTCEGAASDALDGDELLSLGWAFLAAGATGVVASLWPTYEEPGRALMEGFYAALTAHGDAGRALAEAQRARIRAYGEGGGVADEPRFWCGVQLLGDVGWRGDGGYLPIARSDG